MEAKYVSAGRSKSRGEWDGVYTWNGGAIIIIIIIMCAPGRACLGEP